MMLSGLQWMAVAGTIAGLLGLVAILAPRSRGLKLTALLLTALFLPMAYLSANDMLSRPKPVHLESGLKHLENAVVVASLLREDEAIYLWLSLDGIEDPRAYRLPWNDQMAVQLHEAKREADEQGTDVQMQQPFDPSVDSDDPVFFASLPEPLPEKGGSTEQPLRLETATSEGSD